MRRKSWPNYETTRVPLRRSGTYSSVHKSDGGARARFLPSICASIDKYNLLFHREAIGNPSQETEAEAWMMLLPMVGKLRSFHQFSKKLNDVVPNILRVICSVQNNEENANKR